MDTITIVLPLNIALYIQDVLGEQFDALSLGHGAGTYEDEDLAYIKEAFEMFGDAIEVSRQLGE